MLREKVFVRCSQHVDVRSVNVKYALGFGGFRKTLAPSTLG